MDGGMLAAIGNRAVTRLSLPERMLQPQALMQRVGGPALLAPFDAAGPLHILLEGYRESADLNLVGCFAARYDMVRLLRNLAALREREAREPELVAAPVERPIFITGLPRSGTTFLHRLLMEDPGNRAPLVWQTIYPYPLSRAARGGGDARRP